MGSSETRELTCIVCPRGCSLAINMDNDGEILSVRGNACKRGVDYAKDECTNPKRTVTTTVRHKDGSVVAVKTDRVIPKGLVFEVMKLINATRVTGNIEVGDVILENAAESGANVVATARKEL